MTTTVAVDKYTITESLPHRHSGDSIPGCMDKTQAFEVFACVFVFSSCYGICKEDLILLCKDLNYHVCVNAIIAAAVLSLFSVKNTAEKRRI
jgi:hypothetical protein